LYPDNTVIQTLQKTLPSSHYYSFLTIVNHYTCNTNFYIFYFFIRVVPRLLIEFVRYVTKPKYLSQHPWITNLYLKILKIFVFFTPNKMCGVVNQYKNRPFCYICTKQFLDSGNN
jgi:hypothetical protein